MCSPHFNPFSHSRCCGPAVCGSGMTAYMQKSHWNLPWRALNYFLGVFKRHPHRPAEMQLQDSFLKPWLSAALRKRGARYQVDHKMAVFPCIRLGGSLHPRLGGFWIQLLCCLKQFQERDSLLKRPSLKKRTVGLNIRKHKNSKKKTQFPDTTCSLSLLFNKSCNSFVLICSLESN